MKYIKFVQIWGTKTIKMVNIVTHHIAIYELDQL